MRKLQVVAIMMLFSASVYAQGYTSKNRVKVPDGRKIIRVDKTKCEKQFEKGYVIKEESIFSITNGSLTAIKTTTLDTATTYTIKKEISTEIDSLGGWANLTPDEKDKSILHINYWLEPTIIIGQGRRIKIDTFEVNCSKKHTNLKTHALILKKDSAIELLSKYSKDEYTSLIKTDLFKVVENVITVYKDSTSNVVDYYLVNLFDNEADYTIQLRNREYISFKSRSWDFGAITIPFKFKPAISKNDIKLKEEFQADLNIGIFGGYTYAGRYRQRLEKEELKDLSKLSSTVGGFLGASVASLDSAATALGKRPFPKGETATIGVVSFGIGNMLSIYNFQLGIFIGIDKGVGVDANNWNYNNKLWYGVGIGYNLKSLFFK